MSGRAVTNRQIQSNLSHQVYKGCGVLVDFHRCRKNFWIMVGDESGVVMALWYLKKSNMINSICESKNTAGQYFAAFSMGIKA
jgi:hypothetical protein